MFNKNYVLVVLLSFLLVPIANAFKLETHLWVGQQVINDLEDDGHLTFKLGDKNVEILVDSHIKNAILNNKSHFLMGNIGPDAAPDVVVGQNVIHPGIRNDLGEVIGWQTDDWLTHLLKAGEDYKAENKGDDIGVAYSYGFLGHASADVFAHTYVNQYAGDVFSITDNEILVEKRHMALEGYIAKHNPPFKDYTGKNLGHPYSLITLDDNYANFIREKMIYNEDIQDEYWKTSTALHLAGYYDLRKSVEDLANNAIWTEIDKAVATFIAGRFGVKLSDEEASVVVGKIDALVKSVNGNVDRLQSLNNDIQAKLSNYDKKIFTRLINATSSLDDLTNDLASLHIKINNKAAQLADPIKCHSRKECLVRIPFRGCVREVTIYLDPSCPARKKAINFLNENINKAITRLNSEVSNKHSEIRSKAIEVKIEFEKAHQSTIAIANALIDVLQIPNAGSSPIKSILLNWLNDIDIAMLEYVKATSQAMLNTMDHNKSSIDPVVTWFEQYNLSILGIPKTGTNAINTVAELKNNIESLIKVIDEAASVGSPLPGASQLITLKNQTIDNLTEGLKSQATDQLITFLPDAWRDLLALTQTDMNEGTLNSYFSQPESEQNVKGLIMIPDMATRVNAEMNLDSSGSYNPNTYPLVYNAIVLAKLSLLSKYDFEKLAIAAGSTDYSQYMASLDNVVAQAIGDIDGNHQWMPIPPPIPNSLNAAYETPLHGYSTDFGFLPWKGDMRNKIFRKLFKGPLSAGIDSPEVVGQSKLIQNDYPYEVCSANPYPDDVNDRLCTVVVLIPIITGLLH